MRGEEEGEAGDQADQAEQGDATDCAYCTVGGVMHAYQAYHADGKFEAVMDSGANINIFTDDLESGLTDVRQSRISVGGFTVGGQKKHSVNSDRNRSTGQPHY